MNIKQLFIFSFIVMACFLSCQKEKSVPQKVVENFFQSNFVSQNHPEILTGLEHYPSSLRVRLPVNEVQQQAGFDGSLYSRNNY